jgi:hypothetical protein
MKANLGLNYNHTERDQVFPVSGNEKQNQVLVVQRQTANQEY